MFFCRKLNLYYQIFQSTSVKVVVLFALGTFALGFFALVAFITIFKIQSNLITLCDKSCLNIPLRCLF